MEKKASQTQGIKSGFKFGPLKTVEVKNEDEAEFEEIELTKRSSPGEKKPSKQMNAISLLTE